MNPFMFSMFQNMNKTPFNIQSLMQTNPMLNNPYAMGIPNNSQTSPYVQYNPYEPGNSPYTQLGQPSSGVPSINDYFDPFQALRQQMQDDAGQQMQPAPVAPQPAEQEQYWIPTTGWGDVSHEGYWSDTPETRKQKWYRTQSQ